MNDHTPRSRLDLADLRAKLGSAQGKDYWRSLEELAETEEFQRLIENEFSECASQWDDPVGRRRFLKLMGASFALAGLTHCTRQPEEKILPYAKFPEETIPGKPRFFASALTLDGYAQGVLVETHMGRPTKIEGNPDHPASLGASDVLGQAAILGLYDPDRSQVVIERGRISSWRSFVGELNRQMESQRLKEGAGLRILTQAVTSPTLSAQIDALLAEFPQAKWHQYEPLSLHERYAGARRAFGDDVHLVHQFDKADVVLALGSDFLTLGPGHIRHAKDFVSRRRPDPDQEPSQATMNRLYTVETAPTGTGAFADHRLRLKPSEFEPFARALAAELGVAVNPSAPHQPAAPAGSWIGPLARDLRAHAGSSIVIAGDEQPASVHALVDAINAELGNFGATIRATEPVEAHPTDHLASLSELVQDMAEDRVEVLVILGGNPAYDAPADVNFAAGLDKVPFRVHLSLYDDETSRLCHWHVPEAHQLEAWGDGRAYDGTVTIQQPMIAPLYNGKSASELVATMHGAPETKVYDLLRSYWRERLPGEDFEKAWRRALHDGHIPDTAAVEKLVFIRTDFDLPGDYAAADADRLEIHFRADTCVYDGRFANLGWLQELPKPLTKLTWDNAALMSPATAERLGLANEDVLELTLDARNVNAPVWVMPGHADDCVTVHLGYGRTRAGRVGNGVGFNAYSIRSRAAFWWGSGLEVSSTGERYALAGTQDHHSMEGRHLVRSGSLEEFHNEPDFAQHYDHAAPPGEMMLFPGHQYEGYAWGMAVDLNSCIGCNACVIGCQSENNIPVIGKEEVLNAREMHWMRLDRYYSGPLDDPETHFQPLMCMHCENAPCELVCPVAATVHSSEGLNDMIYNRCVGTRYCSNNCPYKVRRFNFLAYSDYETPSLKLMNNPDVTVRTRGVMEKCTYCVQRINGARIEAEKDGRKIEDGEVVTACQAVCPADAIVFGDINDPDSRVSRLKASPRNYGLLTELNTAPRTSYLARLTNPNPELAPQGSNGHPEDGEREDDQSHG